VKDKVFDMGIRSRSKDGRAQSEDGAVTAETAIVLPVLVVLLVAGLWAVGVVVANIRCVDAARDAARAVARGEPTEVAQAIAERSAPRGAEVGISHDGPDVHVVVTAAAELDWALLDGLPSAQVEGRATVRSEPGVQEDRP
jgi:hypothetical protein